MTRPLQLVGAADPAALLVALRDALAGDGPAILPHGGAPAGLPDSLPGTVEKRVAVVVETSGSTGRPKRVALSTDALLASAAASEVRLGGAGQWLLALPAQYIAGINVLVRSLAAQTEPVILEPSGFTAEGFTAAARGLDGVLQFTSLVPTQLVRLLESDAALEALRRFDRILVGGQGMPSTLAERANELGLRVTRSYGSSETCGGCVYDGVPIGNTEVRVIDGRVELAGSVLAEGYLNDPAGTDAAFQEHDGRRWYRTDDTGELLHGVLRITGRVDDVIVSGGVKVSLGGVELAVRSLPGLEEVVVVGVPSVEWGEVPVVVSTVAVPLSTVRAAVTARLGRAAAPARILVLERLPQLPSGKPDRVALAALALQ